MNSKDYYLVYITAIGGRTEPVFQGMDGARPDKVVLVNDPRKVSVGGRDTDFAAVEADVRDVLSKSGFSDVEVLEVDGTDYHGVFNAVSDFARRMDSEHPGCRFLINMTQGTHVMAAALCGSAYCMNAGLCYVKRGEYTDDGAPETIHIDIENQNEIAVVSRNREPLGVLADISGGLRTNEELRSVRRIAKSTLSRDTGFLAEHGLIRNDGTRRSQEWVVTEKGSEMLKRIRG